MRKTLLCLLSLCLLTPALATERVVSKRLSAHPPPASTLTVPRGTKRHAQTERVTAKRL